MIKPLCSCNGQKNTHDACEQLFKTASLLKCHYLPCGKLSEDKIRHQVGNVEESTENCVTSMIFWKLMS